MDKKKASLVQLLAKQLCLEYAHGRVNNDDKKKKLPANQVRVFVDNHWPNFLIRASSLMIYMEDELRKTESAMILKRHDYKIGKKPGVPIHSANKKRST